MPLGNNGTQAPSSFYLCLPPYPQDMSTLLCPVLAPWWTAPRGLQNSETNQPWAEN